MYVYYLDCDGGNMSVYIFPNSLNVYINIVHLFVIYELYVNKSGKKTYITYLETCLPHSKHSIILILLFQMPGNNG